MPAKPAKNLMAILMSCSMLVSCGGEDSAPVTPPVSTATPTPTPTPSPTPSPTPTSSTGAIDPTRIPVGDGKLSTTAPQVGYVYSCTSPTSTNPPGKAPWITADGLFWDSTAKTSVMGEVAWDSVLRFQRLASQLRVEGNGLPNHKTGTFPIAANDPARALDGNPNAIEAVAISWGLPLNPVVAATPTCTGLGAIGVLLSGARIFNALDADGRDAVAHEVQDICQGHPQGSNIYHYHNVSRCVDAGEPGTTHSPLVGYIADGFGIYGNRGEGGKQLTNADLDMCHGHTHDIEIDGVVKDQYHYHATAEYPYTVGCYRGTPVQIR